MNKAVVTGILFFMASGGYAEDTATTASGVQPYSPQRGSVSRATFTTSVVNREPTDTIIQLDNTSQKVFYFTELNGFSGKTVYHRWEYRGKVMAEVGFRVGGPRWRVSSSKQIDPRWTGDWTVVVVDEDGWPLKASVLSYTVSEPDNLQQAVHTPNLVQGTAPASM